MGDKTPPGYPLRVPGGIGPGGRISIVTDSGGNYATAYNLAAARLIARAVNSHEELLGIARQVAATSCDDRCTSNTECIHQKAEDVIAEAVKE